MSGEPENIVLVYLRRIDANLDRLGSEVQDPKQRVTSLELAQARTPQDVADLHVALAGVQVRLDKIDARLERIERRLDLHEVHP